MMVCGQAARDKQSNETDKKNKAERKEMRKAAVQKQERRR